MRKQLLKMAAILLCAAGLLAGTEQSAAFAKEEQAQGAFSGEVAILRQENNGYVMQVTAANSGEDFTGTVQVVFAGSDYENSAYNTEITLPAQGKKQFTINVASTAVETTQGICALNFLDEEGELLQSIALKNVFYDAITEVAVGVLSDDYDGLGFMAAKGEKISTNHGYYPVKLTELDQDNLIEHLDGLYYLIIDQFDSETLGKENIEAVQDWVRNGGWLLIGTGEYGEQTLSGFDQDFIDAEVAGVSEPGEENNVSADAYPYGYQYTMYTNDGVDFINMAIADVNYSMRNGSFYESSDNPAICSSVGYGGVLIYYCSLGDEELKKLSSYTVASMYEEFTYMGYQYDAYSEWEYIRERALAFIDNVNTNVDFTGLKVMILLYVVLAGPVLYLILRKSNKCEWYWIGVPVLGVLFIAGVYLLGQGIRVKETNVYSVTAQRVDSTRKDTYFIAYHSGTSPWDVQLKEEYDMTGPGSGQSGYYYAGYNQSTDDYFYVFKNGSEGLSAGILPAENFDNGFFYAGGKTESKGTISCENLKTAGRGMSGGTITNNTVFDMSYMAVWCRNSIMVFSDVKAGETIDLEQAVKAGRCVYMESAAYCDELFYDMIPMYNYHYELEYEADDIAALLIGLGIANNAAPAKSDQIVITDQTDGSETEQAVIIGVIRNYEKTAAGKCNEISYGCLYTYAEAEGGRNASN